MNDNITFDEVLAKNESDEVYGKTWLRKSNVTNGIKQDLTEYQKTWMHDERCETCSHWSLSIPADQPPDGWGVYGMCGELTAIHHKEHRTSHNSYCEFYHPVCTKVGRYAISRIEETQ